MKKLALQLEDLAVDSFATDGRDTREPGTVHGQADDCTYFQSCLCKTAYYNCGTGPHTIYSCTYTNDLRCARDTSFEQCATPPELG
ncbi:MAG TPA: hypothetical protein VE871_05780 [Longimicrobium sp.]|nr:hypothetical protein [Longimicrobium sp.]